MSPTSRLIQPLTALVLTGIVVLTLGRDLNPFAESFFSYHDVTQASRIFEFAKELRAWHIPPQNAPDYAWGNGYPVFTFYAPTAYWITSLLHLGGFEVLQSIKLSFLLAIIAAFWGMYILCRGVLQYAPTHQLTYASAISPLLPAFLYVSSPWISSEIFVRGNLAEMWLISLLPWGVWALLDETASDLLAAVLLALLFTSHNALSLVAMALCAGIVVIAPHPKKATLRYGAGLLLTVGFWLPFFARISTTYASEIARRTEYFLHFLCLSQLWVSTSGWGFGGSLVGCEYDGMSFIMGKVQLILGLGGVAVLLISFLQRRSVWAFPLRFYLLMLVTCVISVVMTLELSAPIWDHVSALQSFQFPWRFLPYVLFSMTLLAGYGIRACLDTSSQCKLVSKQALSHVPQKSWLVYLVVVGGSCASLWMNAKYFSGQPLAAAEARSSYSMSFIQQRAIYMIQEYIPRTVDLHLLMRLEKTPPTPDEAARLKAQFAAYKSPYVLYTIAHLFSVSVLCVLIWYTISQKTPKKA